MAAMRTWGRSWRAWALLACVLAASMLHVSAAVAEGVSLEQATDEQKASARDAFMEARKAFDERRFVDALKGFQASFDIVASPNTLLMIAHAEKELGRDAAAYESFAVVAEQAEAAAATDPKYGKTAEIAREELGKLRASVALLTVDAPGADEAASLTVGGKKLERERWGKPVAVTPGNVTVVLSSGGKSEVREVTTTAGGEEALSIAVTEDAPIASPEPAPARGDVDDDDPNMQQIFAFVAGGVGVAAFVMAGVFGGLALGKHDDLEAACGESPCPPDRQEDIDQGRTYQTVSNVMVVVGVLGVGAGAALYLTDMFLGDDEESEDAEAKLNLGPGWVGLSGSF